jgi:hypothetical protein
MACRTMKRGYGAEHQRRRKAWAQAILGGGVQCRRCGRPIVPGMPWDLGHVDLDRSLPTWPEHRTCNRATAGRRSRRRPVPPSRDW